VKELPTLEGFKVRLRPPSKADVPALFTWYNDPEIVAPYDRFTVDTVDGFEAELEKAPADPASLAPRLVVERKEDAHLIGLVGYYRADPVLELTDIWYVLGEPAERGKGYGTEAVGLLIDHLFHEFDIERVGATVDVANAPSLKLLEHLGIRREGTLRSALYHHAAWHDVEIFGVTRREWADRPRTV
jgi:RimJ/RimL family protein N-acetyltransferase